MARTFRYLTHPEVRIDPSVSVPDWGLSERGEARTLAFRRSPVLKSTRSIFSSGERKARETAGIVAAELDLEITILDRSHENDRSATGFLEPKEFEAVAEQFFAAPTESVRGWERAVDAQARIVAEATRATSQTLEHDILMVGHGGVGTLVLCHLAGLEIDRKHDQVGGGGNIFAFDIERRSVLHAWRPMESFLGGLVE